MIHEDYITIDVITNNEHMTSNSVQTMFLQSEAHQQQCLLSADQSAVLLKRIELSCLVRECEQEHFSTNHELPIDDDYNKLIKLLATSRCGLGSGTFYCNHPTL